MGLAKRIIPTILCRGRALVKGKRFDSWRSVGVAAQAVRIHAARQVDEVCLLDIGATVDWRGPNLDLVRELTAGGLFSPLSVGGGVRSLEDAKALLRAGADKVVIGTALLYEDRLLQRLRDAVGSQAIVASLDVKGGVVHCKNGRVPAVGPCHEPLHPVLWARELAAAGAGEILLTSIDREGTMEGYDLALIANVRKAVDIPIIAHGGCSGYPDMKAAIDAGANAVAAGALFQFEDCTPRGAAEYLARQGIEVRL